VNDEIKTLREELARLRERIAVLESKPWPIVLAPMFPAPAIPPVIYPPFVITCDARDGCAQ
jgi:hypothetical protein